MQNLPVEDIDYRPFWIAHGILLATDPCGPDIKGPCGPCFCPECWAKSPIHTHPFFVINFPEDNMEDFSEALFFDPRDYSFPLEEIKK